MSSSDPVVDIGFIMCLIGMIFIILFAGLLFPQTKHREFNKKIIAIGSVVATIGGLMILVRIV